MRTPPPVAGMVALCLLRPMWGAASRVTICLALYVEEPPGSFATNEIGIDCVAGEVLADTVIVTSVEEVMSPDEGDMVTPSTLHEAVQGMLEKSDTVVCPPSYPKTDWEGVTSDLIVMALLQPAKRAGRSVRADKYADIRIGRFIAISKIMVFFLTLAPRHAL